MLGALAAFAAVILLFSLFNLTPGFVHSIGLSGGAGSSSSPTGLSSSVQNGGGNSTSSGISQPPSGLNQQPTHHHDRDSLGGNDDDGASYISGSLNKTIAYFLHPFRLPDQIRWLGYTSPV